MQGKGDALNIEMNNGGTNIGILQNQDGGSSSILQKQAPKNRRGEVFTAAQAKKDESSISSKCSEDKIQKVRKLGVADIGEDEQNELIQKQK